MCRTPHAPITSGPVPKGCTDTAIHRALVSEAARLARLCDWCDEPATVSLNGGADRACTAHLFEWFRVEIAAGEPLDLAAV